MPRPRAKRRIAPSWLGLRLSAAVFLAAMVAGCTSGPAGSGAAAASIPAAPTSITSTGPVLTPRPPMAVASPSTTPDPLTPAPPTVLTFDDPAIRLDLPSHWIAMPDGFADSQLIAAEQLGVPKAAIAYYKALLESDRYVGGAIGPTPAGVVVTLRLETQKGPFSDDDLEAYFRHEADLSKLKVSVERSVIEDGDRRISRIVMLPTYPKPLPEGQVPSQVVAYAIPLEDGRTLLLSSTGTRADETFLDAIDQLATGVRETS